MSENAWSPLTIVFALIYLAGSVSISGGPALTQWASKRGYTQLAVAGLVIFTLGGIFWNAGAMNMPPLLVAPLLTSVLIMNVLFAKYVNKESPTKYDAFGSLSLAAYMILLVIGQPGDSQFHCRYITKTCAVTYNPDDACLDYEQQMKWIINEVIFSWSFGLYLILCALAVVALIYLNWHIRYHKAAVDPISGRDVDIYRLTFSCIGGIFGGSEDIFILFLSPMTTGLFAGCGGIFWKQWLLYIDIIVVVLWFIFQMWWVSRGVLVAGAKLNGTLELVSHQFSTLFGIQLGLLGFGSFDKNLLGLSNIVSGLLFVLALVFGVIGSGVLMRGYSVFRIVARPNYRISIGGSLHEELEDRTLGGASRDSNAGSFINRDERFSSFDERSTGSQELAAMGERC